MKKQLAILFFAVMVSLGVRAQNHWVPNPHQFPTNMNVVAILQINGVEQQNESLELGVFYGDECRGSQRLSYYAPPIDRYLLFLTVYGTNGNEFSFRLYDHRSGHELECVSPNVMEYSSNAIIGMISQPYVFYFEGGQCSVEVETTPHNAGVVEGGGVFPCGALCTLRSQPFPGSTFKGWLLEGDTLSTDEDFSFNVLWDTELIACFERFPFTVSVSCQPDSAGTVTGGGEYYYGETCTLTFIPESHYSLVNWSENGAVLSLDNPYSFVVEGDCQLVANTSYYDGLSERHSGAVLFPNPASRLVHVGEMTEQGFVGYSGISVFEVSGKMVLQGCSSPFDVSSLLPGVYYVKASNAVFRLVVLF